mgnify:FL=1
MYRLTVETLLGVQLEVDDLRIAPCILAHWESYKIHYRYRETVYHITVRLVGEKIGACEPCDRRRSHRRCNRHGRYRATARSTMSMWIWDKDIPDCH